MQHLKKRDWLTKNGNDIKLRDTVPLEQSGFTSGVETCLVLCAEHDEKGHQKQRNNKCSSIIQNN